MREALDLKRLAALSVITVLIMTISIDASEESSTITCLGKVVPGEKVIRLAAPSPATVAECRVTRGESVKKGQILATLSNYEIAIAQVEAAAGEMKVAESMLAQVKSGAQEHSIAAQEATLARHRAELENAKTSNDRNIELFKRKSISKAMLEKSKTMLKVAQETVNAAEQIVAGMKESRSMDISIAEGRLQVAKANHAAAKANVELSLIRAPINGKILKLNTRPGEIPLGTGVMEIGDTSRTMVNAEVYVTDIKKVKIGANATITGDAFAETHQGTVDEIFSFVGDNAIQNPDPFSFSDRRIVMVRIHIQKPGNLVNLINAQVTVEINCK